jgi:hypothetical protein
MPLEELMLYDSTPQVVNHLQEVEGVHAVELMNGGRRTQGEDSEVNQLLRDIRQLEIEQPNGKQTSTANAAVVSLAGVHSPK